jgi:hypothetical protein
LVPRIFERWFYPAAIVVPDPKALIPPIDIWLSMKLAKVRAFALACRR